ncbi:MULTISPECIES: hypothetical protein [Citrobacter freundii complex]|uniref:Uncharacterized protein n=1 Tax=Citrobacter freundii TaxID=546 RepID=A0A8H9UKT5_CITFR|nr:MULTISPECIES: hypothetical protein [Citrobacter freundii complex]AUV43585.1 hypothetical protein C2U43_12380 [Citrobacter freundii complex sp. CFNIH9]EKA2131862.1 hypothetical protein [Citrobacter freundii]EKX9625047.1 hypothetical protein [Citrobacter freundii]MDN4268264.1 hypothetical protein [Citrobacter freundii]MDN4278511.1 hypothetical protein [Citrobacter freundii]
MNNKTQFTKDQLTEWAEDCRMLAQCAVDARPDDVAAAKNLALAEIVLAVLTVKPFMYGIEDCDGMAYFAEHCVSSNPAHLSDELQTADDESGEGAKVIPLYRLPEIN